MALMLAHPDIEEMFMPFKGIPPDNSDMKSAIGIRLENYTLLTLL
jgi:hypothetical protein